MSYQGDCIVQCNAHVLLGAMHYHVMLGVVDVVRGDTVTIRGDVVGVHLCSARKAAVSQGIRSAHVADGVTDRSWEPLAHPRSSSLLQRIAKDLSRSPSEARGEEGLRRVKAATVAIEVGGPIRPYQEGSFGLWEEGTHRVCQ